MTGYLVVVKMDEPIRGNVPVKPWIVKNKNGVRVVMCPYCGRLSAYPYDECICGNEVAMPDKPESVKKEWW